MNNVDTLKIACDIDLSLKAAKWITNKALDRQFVTLSNLASYLRVTKARAEEYAVLAAGVIEPHNFFIFAKSGYIPDWIYSNFNTVMIDGLRTYVWTDKNYNSLHKKICSEIINGNDYYKEDLQKELYAALGHVKKILFSLGIESEEPEIFGVANDEVLSAKYLNGTTVRTSFAFPIKKEHLLHLGSYTLEPYRKQTKVKCINYSDRLTTIHKLILALDKEGIKLLRLGMCVVKDVKGYGTSLTFDLNSKYLSKVTINLPWPNFVILAKMFKR